VDSPSWGNLIEWEEQEAAAHVTAPAATVTEPSTSDQGAAESPAGPIDVRPMLQDLDLIHAVWMARPDQADHIVDTLVS